MRAYPEPGDLVTLQKPEGSVSQGDANRVDRLADMNLLELQARMLGVRSKEAIRLSSRFLGLSCDTTPRSVASHAISQLVGVEFRRSARSDVSASLCGELAQSVL